MTIALTLAEATQLTQGKYIGKDLNFTVASIDTRTLKKGELFVAIKGDNFDGHDFIEQAKKAGACACLVERELKTDLPQIIVKNARIALGLLAADRRQRLPIPLIAVTGSCGKTTTRSMLQSITQQMGPVLASTSSFNNDIGVPLTMMQMNESHRYVVLEMGMNHFGELSYITSIAKPNVAIITNIGPVHLEGVGNLAGVAKAKGEIFEGLPVDGIAVFEADTPYASQWRDFLGKKKSVTFGLNENADVRAINIHMQDNGHANFTLVCSQGEIDIRLPVLGQHNVMNALAAAAATLSVGASLKNIKEGLEAIQPVTKRLVEHKHQSGAVVIDDTYNANPASVRAAIAVLMQARSERKILVLGDMRELGEQSPQLHLEIGQAAKQAGVNELYAWGDLSANTVRGFGNSAKHFPTKDALIAAVKPLLQANTTMLIKGSRGVRMEEVVKALLETKD